MSLFTSRSKKCFTKANPWNRTIAAFDSHYAQAGKIPYHGREVERSRSGLQAIPQGPREAGRDGGNVEGAQTGRTI